LGIAKRLSKYLSISHSEELRQGIGRELSWTNSVRFDNYAIVQEVAEAITSIEQTQERDFILKFLRAISDIATFNRLWVDFKNEFLWKERIKRFINKSSAFGLREDFVRGLFGLPVRLLQYNVPKKCLDNIYEELLGRLSLELDQDKKGNVFEAMWLIDRLRDRRGVFQFFLNGMIVIDPEKPKSKQDDNEFDVIELLINDEGKAECWVYACSIADHYRSKNEEQLRSLLDYLHESFPDLTIRTWYVIPENKGTGRWEPKREDTGRNVLLD
jgi:hypothetical protein